MAAAPSTNASEHVAKKDGRMEGRRALIGEARNIMVDHNWSGERGLCSCEHRRRRACVQFLACKRAFFTATARHGNHT